MTHIDTRCFNCVEMPQGRPSEEDKFNTLEYQGKGVFKCPNCGDVLDLSQSTYDVRMKVWIDPTLNSQHEKPWFEFEIIDPIDPRIIVKPKKKNEMTIKKQMESDLPEYQEEWWDGSTGVFDLELYFQWESSGYYVVEWDLEMKVLKKTSIEPNSIGKESP